MHTFNTRFRQDVSPRAVAMRRFQKSVSDAVSDAISKANAEANAGSKTKLMKDVCIKFGSWGIKEVSSSVIKLAADMQTTKVAFEGMLGSSEKAKKVLGDLSQFAVSSPFKTEEVIAAGRQLLNAGVATEDLTGKLSMLGNISIGTGAKLGDMVSLYAKMASSGKAETAELNQMSENGIPIYKTLTDMLKINKPELIQMAESGQISFELISAAMEKLGGKGGQYFGLIEKQSQTLEGRWGTLEKSISMLATSFGEMMIPQLTEFLNNLIEELDRLKETGELDANMKKLADTLMELLRTAVGIATWLAENRETLFAAGKVVAYWMVWQKLNGVLEHTGSLMNGISRTNFSFQGLRQMSGTFKYLTADTRALVRAFGGVQTALVGIGSAVTVAFTGWEIGKQIADVLKLEDAFTRMFLKAQGKTNEQVDKEMADYEESKKNGGKPKPSTDTVDLADAAEKKAKIGAQLKDDRSKLAILEKSKDPNAKKYSEAIKEEIQQLEAEAAAIDKSVNDYETKVKQAALREKEILKEAKVLSGNEEKARKNVESKQATYDKVVAEAGPPPMSPEEVSGPGQGNYAARTGSGQALREKAARDELNNAKTEHKAIKDQQDKLADERTRAEATQTAYIENKKKLADTEKKNTLKAAKEQAAVDAANAKRQAEQDKKAAEEKVKRADDIKATQDKIAEERKKLAKDMQSFQEDKYHDAMSEKIKKWQNDIDGYRKKIGEAEKALQKFGLNIEDDILKTPQQIAQEKKDDILKTKIESYNRGEKVTFTKEEKARVAELQAKQKSGRDAKAAQEKAEGDIKQTEKDVEKHDRTRKEQDWKDRAKEMQDKSKSLDSAGKKIEDAQKNPNASLETVMKEIAKLLKDKLPEETK